MTPSNITSGFSPSGISPFNVEKFSENDFSSAFVTDHPNPENPDPVIPSGSQTHEAVSSTALDLNVGTSKEFSPHVIGPLPKSAPRTESGKGRKRRKAAILIDTPEKSLLEDEKRKTEEKKCNSVKKHVFGKKGKGKKKAEVQRKQESSSEEDETHCLACDIVYNDNEEWVQCRQCRMWAHWDCAKKDPLCICINCKSDNESFSE